MGTKLANGGWARLVRWAQVSRLACGAALATLALLLPASVLAADAQIASLVDSPDPVAAGGLYSYTMRVDNNAVDASTNTRLTFTVPANAVFVSAAPASQNCALVSATTVLCDLGSLGPFGADVRNIVLTWRATVAGPSVINATALLSADNDANPANNSQNATTTVIAGANLGLTKTGTPDPAIGGGPVTYTLTTRNTGPNDGGAMVITDNLPPSVSFVSAGGSGWLCGHAGGVVTCNRSGVLAVGASAPPVTVVGTVNAAGGTVTNSATVAPAAGGVADPDNSNNTATVNTAVVPGADVRIAQKTVTSAQPATAGQNVTFQIQPRNGGPASAVNAVLSDVLPAGWTFVSASGPNWACGNAGQTVTCSRASLPPGATDNISVVASAPGNSVVAPAGTSYTNTATVASDTPDPNATNNSGAATVLVRPDGADLRLAKVKTPNPVALGANMVSLITLSNGGPRAATGPLRVVEALTGELFVSASGTGWVCLPSGAVVVCDHPNSVGLAVNGALPLLRITTQASSAGVVSNQACTGSSLPAGAGVATARPPFEGDPNPGNDCVIANATSTTVRPDLAISKTTSTPSGGDKIVSVSEAAVTYTLVVGNVSPGADGATGVRFTDAVPGFIVGRTTFAPFVPVVSAGNAVFVCSASAAGTVTCTQSAGTLAPGETVTLPITVNRPLQDGAFTNTAVVTNSREGDPNSANNSASDTVLIEPIADVQMLPKTVLPTAVRAGENATYVISFRNNGPSPALNVRVSDSFTFPAGDTGFTVLSVTSPGLVCALAAGGQITPARPAFSCTVGTLANASAGSVTLVVRPNFMPGNAVRSIRNSAAISTDSREAPDGSDNGNNSQGATLTVNPAALDLLVNKTDVVDPVPYVSGATFLDYRVAVSNVGPSYATGAKITETMTPPAGKRVRFVCDTTAAGSAICNSPALCNAANTLSAAGAPLASFTCDLPPGSAATGPGRGELASGQSKTVFLRFEAPDLPAPNGDVFINSAISSANEPDTSTANDREDESTTTRQRIDLRLAKTSSAASVALNQPFNWTVTVQNRGPGNSLRTDMTDSLPAGAQLTGPVTFVRTLPAGNGTCSVAGAVVTCLLGQLDAAGVATVTLPARFTSLPAGGSGSNSATVDTNPVKTGGLDTPGGNNSGSSAVVVSAASLSGTVFEDRDRAGANAGTPQAAALEPRLAGVLIRLTGNDAFGNAVDLSTSTDASGNYLFAALPPSSAGGYTVTETQPAGYVNSPAAAPASGPGAPSAGGTYSAGGAGGAAAGNSSHSGVVLLAGAGASTAATQYNFPEVRRPSLSGFVYLDSNLSGAREPGSDAPIAGATVRLLDAASGALLASTSTDGSGAYSFSNLDPLRAYTLEEPLPASPVNLGNGPVNPGLVGGAACASGCTAQPDNPAAGTDRIRAIDLGQGTDGTAFNFGERARAAISGTVYIDLNRNSALDPTPTDGRIPGVTLTLVLGANCSGAGVATTTTDANGNYSFAGATTGLTYTVCETQPAGYLTGGENPGTNGSSAAANAITISNLPLAGSAGNHFAEIASNSAITGRVWLDANNNGLIDAAEAGIAGVAVTLTGTDSAGNALSRSTTTDATGNYRFDALAPGIYSVQEPAQPAGTLDGRTVAGPLGGVASGVSSGAGAAPSTINNITLGLSQTAAANNFGEIAPAQVAGRVYADNNNDGRVDATETGLAGVVINLTGTDDSGAAVNLTSTTAADGSYAFANLRPGSYTLTEPVQPAGTVNGITSPGSLGGTATPASSAPSAISAITVPVGGQALANNFGEIGNSADLRVAKFHAPATFTVNNLARYSISVRNAGELASSGAYTVNDRLPPGLTLAAVPVGGGWLCTGAVGDSAFSCTSSAAIAAGARGAASITVAVNVGAQAVPASPVNNAVLVDGGGQIDARRPGDAERALFNGNPAALPVCDAALLNKVCRDPAPVQLASAVSGVVWSDIGSATRLLDGGDKRLAGWTVEIVSPTTGAVLASATTGADGSYRVGDLVPGVALAVRFRDPASGVVFGYPVNGHSAPGASGAACDANNAPPAGSASSCVGSGANPALTVVLASGQELTQQSLPVDPSGVVYDSGNRQPVPGAIVTLAPLGVCTGWNPASQLVGGGLGGYAINGGSVAMTVGVDGFYQFLFAPSAPPSCTFAITVTPPAGYIAPSGAIPPTAGTLSPPGGGAAVFAVQPQAGAPTAAPGSGTTYHLLISAGSAVAAIVHNHLPIDPALPGGISLSKTGDKAVAELGDTVRYTVTVQLTAGTRPRQTTVVDRLPAGFTFVPGSAMVDGVAITNPVGGVGPVLAFNLGAMPASNRQVLQYRVRVGVGSQQGDGINRARAHACAVPASCVGPDGRTPVAGSVATNEGQYRVRVSGGVFGVEACVLGKIFVDCNGNHVQDAEELGIPGVRLVLSDGSTLISDVEGKYSVCGLSPRSHVIRADPHTLPRGARLTTSSNRNLGDAGSLWLDLKNGELHRADFVEGSCSNSVLDQVKARRAQGEVRAPETERAGRPALRFDSKSAGRDVLSTPQQGTDGANQQAPKPRDTGGAAPTGPAHSDEQNGPTPALPMNRPPPPGRATDSDPAATAPAAPATLPAGGSDAKR